jgi:prepilin-type N-terminal cleavage/methylation domain-containing protein
MWYGCDMRLIRDDRGLTLPELLISMVILTVIIGPLSGALIVYMRNSEATVIRMSESQDVQLLTTYFAGDVQSLGIRAPNLSLLRSVGNSSYPCTTTGTSVLLLAWDEFNGNTKTTIRVNYVVRVVGTERRLVRVICQGDASPDGEIVLVHNLVGTPVAPSCSPASCTAEGVSFPQSMAWTVDIKHPKNPEAITTVHLTGQRRQT